MLYEQYFIDDLKDRADLVRIIEPYARDLKKKGANWMACCPFHQEKTPSFSISPSKGFYKCFGCGKGGNAFTFLMEMEGLNFVLEVRDPFCEIDQELADLIAVAYPEVVGNSRPTILRRRSELSSACKKLIISWAQKTISLRS